MKFLKNRKYISSYLLAILIIISLFYSYTAASAIQYPTNEWNISAPEEQGIHSKAILELMEVIKEKRYNIHSVTIVRNGNLVLDSYLYPFKDGQKNEMHSATKSVTS